MTYTGTIRNGVVVLDNGASLADGTQVQVVPIDHQETDKPPTGTLFDIGRRAVRTGQPDLATNLDHYLYGHPKVSDEQP